MDRATLVGRTCIFRVLFQYIRVQLSSMKYLNDEWMERCAYIINPISDATFTLGGHDSQARHPTARVPTCHLNHVRSLSRRECSDSSPTVTLIIHLQNTQCTSLNRNSPATMIFTALAMDSCCPGLGGQRMGELCLILPDHKLADYEQRWSSLCIVSIVVLVVTISTILDEIVCQ